MYKMEKPKYETRLLTQKELSFIHEEERSILKEIHRLCMLHGIKYYIVGGTLLGAVRHGGFIPWDDDIDIAMYREDFKKFKKVCLDELGEDFFLQDIYTDPGYNQMMPKVRKNGTLLDSPMTVGLKMHKGLFVDIFMLDYAKKKTKMLEIKHDFHWALLNLFSRKQCHNIKSRVKRAVVALIPAKLIVRLSDWILSEKESADYTVNYTSIYGVRKQTFPTEYYGDGVEIEFDGLTVMAPCKYKDILTQIYGDYMKLPPVEKRGLHHKVVDFIILDKN